MESKTSKRRLEALQREEQVFALRMRGFSYREIAKEVGVHADSAHLIVKRAFAKYLGKLAETAAEVRDLEIARLDYMLSKLDPKIEGGDPQAIATALRIQERRSKLLGLDAPPQKQIIELQNALTPEQLEQAIRDKIGAEPTTTS